MAVVRCGFGHGYSSKAGIRMGEDLRGLVWQVRRATSKPHGHGREGDGVQGCPMFD